MTLYNVTVCLEVCNSLKLLQLYNVVNRLPSVLIIIEIVELL